MLPTAQSPQRDLGSSPDLFPQDPLLASRPLNPPASSSPPSEPVNHSQILPPLPGKGDGRGKEYPGAVLLRYDPQTSGISIALGARKMQIPSSPPHQPC